MKLLIKIIPFLLLIGCANVKRNLYSDYAKQFGSNYIIVQYRADGVPMNCWQLKSTSISNEPNSDGISWIDSSTNNLVHISGWYNMVQVNNNDYEAAAKIVGADLAACKNGHYVDPW